MNVRARFVVLAIVLSSVTGILAAQQPPHEASAHVEVPAIAPRAEDVATIDGIMKAFYEVISGPAGSLGNGHETALYTFPTYASSPCPKTKAANLGRRS